MNPFERHARSEPTYQEFLERDEALACSAERRHQALVNAAPDNLAPEEEAAQ